MKKAKKSLLTALVIAIFTFSCITLGVGKNIICKPLSQKSNSITIAGEWDPIIDPPVLYVIKKPVQTAILIDPPVLYGIHNPVQTAILIDPPVLYGIHNPVQTAILIDPPVLYSVQKPIKM